MISLAPAILLSLALLGDMGAPKVDPIPSPAAPKSGEPSLVRGLDGQLYLTWIERAGKKATLRLSSWHDDAWSTPRDIASGEDWFVNWADFPSLAVLADGTLAAHWLQKSAPDTYAYDVRVSLSRDSGKTWTPAVTPHRDGTPTEHGFVSIVPSRSTFSLFWLDGREMTGGHGHGSGDMTLRHCTLDPSGAAGKGQLGKELVVDGRVCECCQTSAVPVSGGAILVAYRDRSEDDIRDVAVARIEGGRVVSHVTLGPDRWKIDGCPVNGPALAARESTVAAAWYTEGADQRPRVRLAWSTNGGKTFGAPASVDDGKPMGRVDIALIDLETALVCWFEETETGAEVRMRRLGREGLRDASFPVAGTGKTRASGFPRFAATSRGWMVAWTDTAAPPRVRTALVSLPPQIRDDR